MVGCNLPEKVAGLLIDKELKAFSQVLTNPARPLVAVVGGAKISDKIKLIENLIDKADGIIICGGMAYTFLKQCFGMQIGKSLFDKKGADIVQGILDKAKAKGCEVTLPVDWLCGQEFKNDQETKLATREEGIPDGWEGMDCGPKSMELFANTVKAAKTVVWNGPAGVFEFDNFSKGTKALLDAVAGLHASGGVGIIGGGDSATAAAKWDMEDKVSFVSTGGGASLELLEGKVLPGIAALTDAPPKWEGTVTGKYQWDDSKKKNTDADKDMSSAGDAITKYSWGDGKKQVSIYIELDGLDDCTEDMFQASSGEKDVSLTIAKVCLMKVFAVHLDSYVQLANGNSVVNGYTESTKWVGLAVGDADVGGQSSICARWSRRRPFVGEHWDSIAFLGQEVARLIDYEAVHNILHPLPTTLAYETLALHAMNSVLVKLRQRCMTTSHGLVCAPQVGVRLLPAGCFVLRGACCIDVCKLCMLRFVHFKKTSKSGVSTIIEEAATEFELWINRTSLEAVAAHANMSAFLFYVHSFRIGPRRIFVKNLPFEDVERLKRNFGTKGMVDDVQVTSLQWLLLRNTLKVSLTQK
ncbi:PGK1 [Symbiodinium microadriaticum]|nr:PGK1 [Symbiodinium microadriaticum]